MNLHRLISQSLRPLAFAQLFAVFALPLARSQVAPTFDAARPTPAQLAKYDKNKDGVLDAAELAAQRADEAKAVSTMNTSAESARSDAVVQLSPFEVKGEEDKGYLASSTLSGTRMNSRLEDLAASISVVTKQQLMDTAAVDINDIFLYEANTEGTGQFTDPTTDARGIYDNVAGNPQTANRIRGLGASNIARNGFAGTSALPIDTYNVDSVEISRGSNSNIFGMGDASGTVNLNLAKANMTRESSNFQLRGDSYGGFRSSIDLNRPIIKNKLAARFSAVYEEKGFVRKPSTDRTNRWQLGITAKPFRNTTITGSYESYHNFNSRANAEPPRDTIAYWRSQGSPTWDPVTMQARVNGVLTAAITNDALLPAGLTSPGSSNARIMEWIDHGVVELAMRGQGVNSTFQIPGPGINTTTNQRYVFSGTNIQRGGGGIFGGVATPLYQMPETTDRSIYDWTSINTAAPNYNRMRSDNWNLNLEQWFINTPRHMLALQAGWYREDTHEYRRSFVAQQDGVAAILQIDTNERLLDGRANPYFLRPFIGGAEPQLFLKPVLNDNYRAQLAYQLDLTREAGWMKWLGRHRFSGYEEYRAVLQSPSSLRYRDQVVANTNLLGTVPVNLSANNNAHFFPRYFLGNTKGGGIEYANRGLLEPNATLNLWTYLPATGQWNYSDPATVSEGWFALGMQKRQISTAGASLQSYLWNDRIVPTFGLRKDRVYTIDNLPVIADSTGFYSNTSNLRNFGVNKRWSRGDTKTSGVVVKPFRGIAALDQRAQQGSGMERWFAQLISGLNFNYNQSDSFQPADTAYNVFGEILPNPTGTTKDYGVTLNLLDNKLTARITRYDTLQVHARGTTGTIAGRAVGLDLPTSLTSNTNNFYNQAQIWYRTLNPAWSATQVDTAAQTLTGLTPENLALQGKTISDVNDARSKGWELELNFNPTRNWTVKATGAQQEAIDSNLSLFLQQYLDQRTPFWTKVVNPLTGNLWWNETMGSAGIPLNTYTTNILAPLKIAQATQGKRKPQTREFSFNFTTSFQLAGVTENRWLKNVGVGGSFRWASKAAIGYLGAAPDADGQVRSLDRNKPVFDSPTTNLDLLFTYNLRLFSNKVRSRVQLNVRNVTESGTLRGIAVNPDGTIWRYRVIDPRQFILSTSFDL